MNCRLCPRRRAAKHMARAMMRTRAMTSARAAVARPPGDPGEIDIGEVDIGETSLEYTLPPGELDRIFVESKTPRRAIAAKPVGGHRPSEPPHRSGGSGRSFRYSRAALEQLRSPGGGAPRNADGNRSGGNPRAALGDSPIAGSFRGLWLRLPRRCCSSDKSCTTIASGLRRTLHSARVSARCTERWAPRVPPPSNLAAYQLRQWGVTGDPSADGSLRVRASIMNTAAQLEPYPLLRVTLANRFGSMVGTRDFEPSEYLGKPTAKLLAPGERVDATMDILDPGKSAEGFEIDVCLRATEEECVRQ